MTLTNYWWLIIWAFAGGFALSLLPKRMELVEDYIEESWTYTAAILLTVPYIIWTGFRDDSFGDTSTYRQAFLDAPMHVSEWGEYLAGVTKDKGFEVLQLLIKLIVGNSDIAFFLVIGAFQILCIALVLRKYSCDYWFSFFVFIASTDYISWTWNGVRQFVAVSIIFTTTGLMIRKRYFLTILVILLAATIHLTAVLMIPVVFIIQGRAWNRRTLLAIAASMVALLFADQFTDIMDSFLVDTQYSTVVSEWEYMGDNGTNPIRALVYSVPTILSIVGYRWIKTERDPLVHLSVNASIISSALYLISIGTSGIFMGRLPAFVSLYATGILLPWEIHHMFERETAVFIRALAVILFVAFFYYQMHHAWNAF